MQRLGCPPKLKPWRLGGAIIPLDRRFLAREVGLDGMQAKRLKEEGFLRRVGKVGNSSIWEATDRLKGAMKCQQ